MNIERAPRFFKLDGSPYVGENALMEWAVDLEDPTQRVVEQSRLWNGLLVSTIWIGLRDQLFETMIFDELNKFSSIDGMQLRYKSFEEARVAHLTLINTNRSVLQTLLRWFADAMIVREQ